MDKNSKKILIIKIGAIGDTVMALSIIKAIEDKYPGAEITWVCGEIVQSIIRSCPAISNIITVDERKLLTGNYLSRINVMIKLWLKIFLKSYDIVLIPYRDSRYKILSLFTFRKALRDMTGRNRMNSFIPGRYHASEYARMILEQDDYKMPEPGFPEVNIQPDKYIDEILSAVPGKRIVLNPGGAKNLINSDALRRWPATHYKELAELLIKQNFNVIIIGAEEDKWVLEHFSDLKVTNLIGKTTLTGLIYLFRNCDMLVTHDTGAMHLAKLSGIKITALFGPVDPYERVGASENIKIFSVSSSLPCSPCYNGRIFAECSNNICMKNIEVQNVYEYVRGSFAVS